MQSPACLVVRAQVLDEPDIPKFDHWYETEHLPDAKKAFGVARAWRCWSLTSPHEHFAFYEFESGEVAMAVLKSDATKELIAEFDRVWGERVTRTREILKVAGRLG